MEIVVLNIRAPEAGKVLPGMKDLLTPEQATTLYKAYLEDTFEFTQEMGLKRVFYCTPTATHPFFQELAKRFYIDLVDATAATPGARIKEGLDAGFKKGGSKVLLWDAETPAFPPKLFKEGFTRLEKADLLLGPAMDFGIYLFGAKGKTTSIFENVKWETPAECADLVRNAEAAKLTVYLHSTWVRFRKVTDLPFFVMNLKQQLKTAPKLARHTVKALTSLNLLT